MMKIRTHFISGSFIIFCFVMFFSFSLSEKVFAANKNIVLKYDEKKTNLFVGEKYRLKVQGTKARIIWKSSDKKVVAVSRKGTVKGKKAGKATITAIVKGKKYNLTFTVDFTVREKPIIFEKTEKEKEVMEKIKEFRSTYPEGMKWGNDRTYYCSAVNTIGGGCVALAFEMNDILFGKALSLKRFENFENIEKEIRIGDIIRINNDTHSVLVIDRDSDGVIVVEGNIDYNDLIGIVHWDERFSYEELKKIGSYYQSRHER